VMMVGGNWRKSEECTVEEPTGDGVDLVPRGMECYNANEQSM